MYYIFFWGESQCITSILAICSFPCSSRSACVRFMHWIVACLMTSHIYLLCNRSHISMNRVTAMPVVAQGVLVDASSTSKILKMRRISRKQRGHLINWPFLPHSHQALKLFSQKVDTWTPQRKSLILRAQFCQDLKLRACITAKSSIASVSILAVHLLSTLYQVWKETGRAVTGLQHLMAVATSLKFEREKGY